MQAKKKAILWLQNILCYHFSKNINGMFLFLPWKDFQISFPYLMRFLWSRIVNIVKAETALPITLQTFLSF